MPVVGRPLGRNRGRVWLTDTGSGGGGGGNVCGMLIKSVGKNCVNANDRACIKGVDQRGPFSKIASVASDLGDVGWRFGTAQHCHQ
jgi:hypothetical protein